MFLLLIRYECASISTGLCIIFVDAGYFSSRFSGLIGRFSKPPPQFGHTCFKTVSIQSAQNVHSNVQIMASVELNGNDLLQCSQVGLISSISFLR